MKDGGPAFPRQLVQVRNREDFEEHELRTQDGMTLRDFFAAKALQGLLAYPGDESNGSWHNNASITSTVLQAYRYADSMILAREVVNP